jgi:hypothetical protein
MPPFLPQPLDAFLGFFRLKVASNRLAPNPRTSIIYLPSRAITMRAQTNIARFWQFGENEWLARDYWVV